MPGPFTSYVPPGVYTQTVFEPSASAQADAARLPVFIGVGEESLSKLDLEVVRGSSAYNDVLITKEDVSAQWVTSETNPLSPTLGSNDGTLKKFRVDNYPVVSGDGTGSTTTSTSDVTVFVDGEAVPVAAINGTLGTITLQSAPSSSSTVTVTYYYSRTDTQFTDDLSDQATGSVTAFKVFNTPIVDGSNGGTVSTAVADVTAKVDGVEVTVSSLNGTTGVVTLASAPSSSSTVTVTYYHNTWQDTYDILRDATVLSVSRVGIAPGDSSYTEDTDFVVKNPEGETARIYWGAAYDVTSSTHTSGAEYFDETQIVPTLIDTMTYLDETSAYVDPSTSVTSTTEFVLTYVPTLGNGRDTTLGSSLFSSISNGRVDLTTDRPDLVTAYVGVDVVDAMSRPPVTVVKVDGSARRITLASAVSPNEKVFATYWTNFMLDDTYTLTVVDAGASGTGTYTVESELTNSSVYQAKFVQKSSISQTLNWGTGSQSLLGIFHDGSGTPVEEYIELTISEESARGATLKTSIEGPWALKSGVSNVVSVNSTSVTLTPASAATVTSSNSETYDLDGLTLYLRSELSSSFTAIEFEGNGLDAEEVADQINGAMRTLGSVSMTDATATTGSLPGADTGVLASDSSGDVVLTSVNVGDDAQIVIGSGDANAVLGFSAGTTTGTSVSATTVAGDLNDDLTGITATVDGNHVILTTDSTGASQTLTLNAVSNDAYDLLGFEAGQTDGGEDAHYTYTVESYLDDEYSIDHTSGSGTGTANIGYVGQTYVDEVTGLRISLLLPEEASSYDDAGTIRFSVLSEFVTDSSNPVYAIPGLEVKVKNTTDIEPGDTALLETFDKAGSEPDIGDVYYISYTYQKTNYDAKVFNSFSDVVAEYGELSPANKLTLAAFLAFANGATQIAAKQVQKATGGTDASSADYLTAIDSLRKPVQRRYRPSIVVPVSTDTQVINFVKTHCLTQSSPRWRQERIGVFGFAQGTTPEVAQSYAESLGSELMWPVYPDSCVVALTDEFGNEVEHIVDGSFMAAAVAGSIVAPAYDVASPLTHRQIVGIKRLVREMDELEKDKTAQSGITVLEDLDPNIRIRQAFTSRMDNELLREPTVITIDHQVRQSMRAALAQFIGVKYLGGVLGDIERVAKSTLRGLKRSEIISSYSQVRAEPDSTDPSAVKVSLTYVPVFPLNYITLKFTLRSKG